MALLPPFFLDAIVALGVGRDPAQRRWVGTGFLYGKIDKKSDPENKGYWVFLVTNKHVLAGETEMVVKFNPLSGTGSQDVTLALRSSNGRDKWIPHPDGNVDLAAIGINVEHLRTLNLRLNFFRDDDHAWTIAQMRDAGVSEGDAVFVLGYPMGLVNDVWQTAICRTGCIARIQDVLNAGDGDFLIDASVFPGNSGGPVVVQPESTSIIGTQSINKANLVGVIQSYLPYQDLAISAQTGQPRIIFDENSGLAPVIPVDRVNELMTAAMRRVRNRAAQARWKAKQQPNISPTAAGA
jgi:S1-C subfamily serine protease